MKPHPHRNLISAAALATLCTLVHVPSVVASTENAESAAAPHAAKSGAGAFSWWRLERARRQAEIDAYVNGNLDEFLSFKNAPIAIKRDVLNFVGIPMIMFRLLPEIFPDIWGKPEDQMAEVGLGVDPFEPDSVMPLGSGYALSDGFLVPGRTVPVRVNYATLSCMACHSGAVTKPNGKLVRLIGAPNPIGVFLAQINRTVDDPRYTAAAFLAALNAKPPGWVYGDPSLAAQEALERNLFQSPGIAAYFLGELKLFSNATMDRVNSTIPVYTYDVPNAPPLSGPGVIPGQIDVFAYAAAGLFDPTQLTAEEMTMSMPAAPAPSDVMSAWRQDGRTRWQWDDSIGNLAMRETEASITMAAGDPTAVNQDNLVPSATFTLGLPSAPYPFRVNATKAERGRLLYERACAGCHAPGNTVLMTPEQTGTDPNRARVFTPNLVEGFIAEVREGCEVPECFEEDGSEIPDSDVVDPTGKYASIPLDGVWATAPYLHNGSVPTLYHLLVGERPATFFRGASTYDRKRVGYTWDQPTSIRSVIYDTSQAGHSNAGHTGPLFNGGIDWKKKPRKLEDLLEYLKTL